MFNKVYESILTEGTVPMREKEDMKMNLHTGQRRAITGTLLVILVTLMVVPGSAMDNEGDMENPTVIITEYTVTPAVLLPGDKGTVTITLMNTARTASVSEHSGVALNGAYAMTRNTDINVYIERVSLEGDGVRVLTDPFERLGSLGPGQSVPVTFVIQAPDTDGIYFPEARIDVRNGRSTRYPVTVNVNTVISAQKKPALSVTRSLPDRVTPGDDCRAEISIRNTGLTRAGDIAIQVNSSTRSLLLASPGRYYVDHLDPGEIHNISLTLMTDKTTPTGIDPVTLTITYLNPDDTLEEQTEIIGVPVTGTAELAVKSFTTEPAIPSPHSPFKLIVRVENTGTGQATSVKVTLDSPAAGTRSAFIGSIGQKSDAPAIFHLRAGSEEVIPVTLAISYTDDSGDQIITEEATIPTGPPSDLPLLGGLILGAALITGAVWYWWIRPGKRNGT